MTNHKNKKITILIVVITVILIVNSVLFYILYKPRPIYYKISYDKLAQISQDRDILDFVPAFTSSCKVFIYKNPQQIITKYPIVTHAKTWQLICNRFLKTSFNNNQDVINFIKNNFNPYLVNGHAKTLITGYYRLKIKGSLHKTAVFKYPIYKIPHDLIIVNLKDFNSDYKGVLIGRVKSKRLVPYYTREDINQGVLKNKNLEIVWTDNKYQVFLLHVQGSGIIELPNNQLMYLSYAGKNGQPFRGIFNYMLKKHYIVAGVKNEINTIDNFFKEHPEKLNEVLNNNKSFIFFKEVDKNSWKGAFNSELFPQRTIAVDRSYNGLGVPYLVTFNGEKLSNNLNTVSRLVVSNDVGSAIRGPARLDLYWGVGKEAGNQAITTNTYGDLVVFIPKVRYP